MATEIQQVKISQLNTLSDWRNAFTVATDRNGQSVNAPLDKMGNIGDLNELDTQHKDTLVEAINEAATKGNMTVDSELSPTSTNPVQNKVIQAALALKQALLESGVNIKTINYESILGPGNIEVQGGEDGVGLDDVSSAQDGTVVFTLTNGDKITIDFNHVHPQYYSKEVETSQPQGGFLPDVIYKLGTLTGSVTFALAAVVTGYANHYFIVFDTGSTAPTISWPSGLTWAAGSAPTVAASKHYEVSIMDGIAAYLEV